MLLQTYPSSILQFQSFNNHFQFIAFLSANIVLLRFGKDIDKIKTLAYFKIYIYYSR